MTLLADKTIRQLMADGAIIIDPFEDRHLQSASYDVTLANEFLVFRPPSLRQRLVTLFHPLAYAIDPRKASAGYMQKIVVPEGKPFVLWPHQFALGATVEVIGVNGEYACELGGKSSLARLGLIVHATAGFIDPGNRLKITFEFFNLSWWQPILLWPGMSAGQVFFLPLDQACERPYGSQGLGSKYLNDMGVRASQMHQNFQ